ncbi:MAG: YihY/virulence factor BrkB family protein [Thermoleophilaceae bacterium]|nr:YihY/virulence factor BrkB family protein [Thermoleophilaceae bacterium]
MGVIKKIWALVSKVGGDIQRDRLTDWAAALTYYSMLSVFPGLIVLVSLLGLIGQSATGPMLENLNALAPGPVNDIVNDAIVGISQAGTTAGVVLLVSLGAALWAASGYIGAFSRAASSIWHTKSERPFWVALPMRVGITALMLGLLALISLMIVFSGPLASELGDLLGVGDGVLKVWSIIKWPLLLFLMMVLLSLLYTTVPGLKEQNFRLLTHGSSFAIGAWLAASLLFSFYVSELATYNKTYGSLGGVIVFLIWLWITNLAILLGVQMDAKRAARKRHNTDADAA